MFFFLFLITTNDCITDKLQHINVITSTTGDSERRQRSTRRARDALRLEPLYVYFFVKCPNRPPAFPNGPNFLYRLTWIYLLLVLVSHEEISSFFVLSTPKKIYNVFILDVLNLWFYWFTYPDLCNLLIWLNVTFTSLYLPLICLLNASQE